MRCIPMRCTPLKYTPMTYTPMRSTPTICMLMRHMHEMQAHTCPSPSQATPRPALTEFTLPGNHTYDLGANPPGESVPSRATDRLKFRS